jgi:transcriptional regulator
MTDDRRPQTAAIGPRSMAARAMDTVRRRMIDLLKSREMDARELSAMVGVGEKEIYDHLVHIRKSVAGRGKTFRLNPAACFSCGFIFRKRQRVTRPSRCPRCRSPRIAPPTYTIAP